MAKLNRGRHDPSSPSTTSYTNAYRAALAATGGDAVVAEMKRYLPDTGYTGFGKDAAYVLRALWARNHAQADKDAGHSSWPDFSDVRARRKARHNGQIAKATEYSTTIFDVVERLSQPETATESKVHALELAGVALSMPFGERQETTDRLLKLPVPISTKLGVLTHLAISGQVIDAGLVAEGIDNFLPD